MYLLYCIKKNKCINSYYAPMIYKASCVMYFMCASGRGLALEIKSFWACEMTIGECHLGPKKLEKRVGSSSAVMLLYRTGKVGEQCGKVTLSHCSTLPHPELIRN